MNLILEISYFRFGVLGESEVHLANNLQVKCCWPEMECIWNVGFCAANKTLQIFACVSIPMSNIVQMLSDKVSTRKTNMRSFRPSESYNPKNKLKFRGIIKRVPNTFNSSALVCMHQ